MNKNRLLIFVFVFSLFVSFSSVHAGTILSSYKYAWSNNIGYINFENVTVSDTKLSGFAWSPTKGFIKFDPAQGGVTNDGTGNLSGFAWGEQLGWIDFNGASIQGGTGKFSGSATGTLAGTINFDCPNYCDVRTDWRQASTSTPVTSSISGGGSGFFSNLLETLTSLRHIDAHNVPLVVMPEQSGILTQDAVLGKITIEVPTKTILKKTTFTLDEEPLSTPKEYLVVTGTELVNNSFYNITATDENGEPVHFFSQPIAITLPLPVTLLNEKNLEVYWLNETNWQWVLIPDAIFSGDKVSFKVSHLTKFAIFKKEEMVVNNVKIIAPKLSLPADTKPLLEKSKTLAVATTQKVTEDSVTIESKPLKTGVQTEQQKVSTQKEQARVGQPLEKKEVSFTFTKKWFSSILLFVLAITLIRIGYKIFKKK